MSHIIPQPRYNVVPDKHLFNVVGPDDDVVFETQFQKLAEREALSRNVSACLVDSDALLVIGRALDLVRRVDMVMSSNRLGHMSAADVTGALYGMGFGNMTRGEILRGGGYA
jgi:hypothetical protein